MNRFTRICSTMALVCLVSSAQANEMKPLPGSTDTYAAAIDLVRRDLCLTTSDDIRSFFDLVPDGGRLTIYPLPMGKAIIVGLDQSGETHFGRLIELRGLDRDLVELWFAVDETDRIVVVGLDESGETHFGRPLPGGTWFWTAAPPSELRSLSIATGPARIDSETAGCRRPKPVTYSTTH